MEFGLFTEFQSPPGMSDAQAFDESMAQMCAAEELGYDAVWLAEIHFQQGRSVLSSPLVVAAGIAGRTRRVKIGIAVQVLPLSHPLHLAEDVATLDHLCKGRLDFGVGRSGLPAHYHGYNIPYSESRERFSETLEILLKAWTQERFSHDGKYYQFRDVCITPKPLQKPHPPLRIAATTAETYPMVGRMGRPLLVVHDRDDATVPWLDGATIADAWPGARLLTTSGLGHRGVARDPAVVSEVVRFVSGGGMLERAVDGSTEAEQSERELFNPDLRRAG